MESPANWPDDAVRQMHQLERKNRELIARITKLQGEADQITDVEIQEGFARLRDAVFGWVHAVHRHLKEKKPGWEFKDVLRHGIGKKRADWSEWLAGHNSTTCILVVLSQVISEKCLNDCIFKSDGDRDQRDEHDQKDVYGRGDDQGNDRMWVPIGMPVHVRTIFEDIAKTIQRGEDGESNRWRSTTLTALVRTDAAQWHRSNQTRRASEKLSDYLRRNFMLNTQEAESLLSEFLPKFARNIIEPAADLHQRIACSRHQYSLEEPEIQGGQPLSKSGLTQWHLKNTADWIDVAHEDDVRGVLRCLFPGIRRHSPGAGDDLSVVKPLVLVYDRSSPDPPFELTSDSGNGESERDSLGAGYFTSVDLVRAYIARIEEVNPTVRAVTEVNPDALSIAAEMDGIRQTAGGVAVLGPLHGIPVLLKGNMATADDMNTTAGSYALVGARPKEDSTVAAKMRKAGAIILGKANMSQWADWRSASVPCGWSAYGGQTVGAYHPGQDPSGSSSGSAVACSLGLTWAALATETSGSISHRAHVNGIVGIKPTVGLTSRYLVVPVTERQDTVGTMTRTVRDAAYLLSAIVGRDFHDNYTAAIPFGDDEMPDYVAACKESGLQGKRLGVAWELVFEAGIDETAMPGLAMFNSTLNLLQSAGAIIVNDVRVPGIGPLVRSGTMNVVAGGDFPVNLQAYLDKLETNPNNITSLAALRDFTRNHPLENFPRYGTEFWDKLLDLGAPNRTSSEFWGNYTALHHYAGDQGLTGALQRHSLDAIVMPTPYSYLLSSYIGTPVVTVPMGRSPDDTKVRQSEDGKLNLTGPNQPFGLGFAGDRFSEVKLIEMAYAFEQRARVRGTIKPHVQALRFKDKCFTSLEYYSLKDVFKSLADQQGQVRYLKEDTVARFLEIPDILGASPVIFQMVSYLGAFPFLQEAPVVLELPQLIMVVVIMTERYKRVLAKASMDRTKLLFKSLAVYDRKVSEAGPLSPVAKPDDAQHTSGFAVDAPVDDPDNDDEEEDDDDDLVLTAYELLDVTQAVKQGSAPEFHGALVPTDNFRKLVMLLLLAAPLDPQESLSQYSVRVAGAELESLRSVAESILAAFVDAEASPGIRYRHFKAVVPVLFPNLFNGFNGLFEHFLFSKNLDFSKHVDGSSGAAPAEPPKIAQPLLSDKGDILNDHLLAQISMFLPGSSLFRRVRRLYSGNDAGFSMGGFQSKVFNWRAPTILLVSGTRLDDVPDGGQETAFAESLPPKRFPHGSKSDRVTFGVYVREPWKLTHKECFGDSETVLFQLEPIHDVFPASTLNTDYVSFTQPPSNQPGVAFGCPHPKPSKSSRRQETHSLGAVSLLFHDSFEFGVFNHDYHSRGGAFHTSMVRKFNFQDRFQIEQLEVWGCGGDEEAKAQAERWAWEAREAEARRKINLGTGDIEADRALLEMAGLIGGNRSGGSMG
ncbi:TLDc domain containing protein 2 [Purpureocillium lavendulum]|uniref:TLDc domain containing protein 2 n=1 Tax=Purpureocillium lavendulum TaxID=1247861 RepID=A0AB34FTH3_9HYPO|nr:TLDc domain containing protein 2 [Purpureocillium lavendulum]